MVDQEEEIIIIDIGSGSIKIGFASSDQPKTYVPTIIGEPKDDTQMVGMDQKPFYYGHEVISKQSMLNITKPVQQGIIVNDDHNFHMLELFMENEIFHNQLRVSPEDHKILITEPPNNPKENREKICDLM